MKSLINNAIAVNDFKNAFLILCKRYYDDLDTI